MKPFKFLLALLLSTTFLQAAATLEWETSTDLKVWSKVPPSELQLTTTGAMILRNAAPQTFYRLRIVNGQSTGYLPTLTLAEAPQTAVQMASGFLTEHLASNNPETPSPDFEWPTDAELAPFCYPVYDPAFENGQKPAYLEFKVVRKTGVLAINALGMSPPQDGDRKSFGYILIGLNQGDAPVPEFSDRGLTKVERMLENLSGPAESIKPIRFDPALIIAENEKGIPVGSLGTAPFQIDPAILELAGQQFDGFANANGEQIPPSPNIPVKGYDSYEQFKKAHVEDPVNQFLRKQRANAVRPRWDTINGATPPVFKLALAESREVLTDQIIKIASADDPKIVIVTFKPQGAGVTLKGNANGATILRVELADGSVRQYIVTVGLGQAPKAAGWTPWRYNFAGTWGDQRRYWQFDRDPQMCTGGASGCGPAAWAMLYGWWDLKGSRRLMSNFSYADAPLYNDANVLNCTRYVFNRVNPLCVSGQAATMPWSMCEGFRWANFRSAGYDINWTWGVPYISPWCIDRARDSIVAGRPSIVGIGFYSHYPLAYGYGYSEYVDWGITWSRAHYFLCNMGWGGDSPCWQDGASFWFATNGRYF